MPCPCAHSVSTETPVPVCLEASYGAGSSKRQDGSLCQPVRAGGAVVPARARASSPRGWRPLSCRTGELADLGILSGEQQSGVSWAGHATIVDCERGAPGDGAICALPSSQMTVENRNQDGIFVGRKQLAG